MNLNQFEFFIDLICLRCDIKPYYSFTDQIEIIMTQKSKLWQIIGISLLLRIVLIVGIGMVQNIERGELYITDIDYKVYSDSTTYPTPYGRHTYRYTPLLSYMMALNYTVYEQFGKIIFSLFDALAIFILWKIIAKFPQSQEQIAPQQQKQQQNKKVREQQNKIKYANFIAQLYGYNPLFLYLTVRGSCESITLVLMYAFWYFMFGQNSSGNLAAGQIKQRKIQQIQPNSMHRIFSYIIFGLWVHFRIYPIIFLPLILLYEYRNCVNQSASKLLSQFAKMALFAGGVFALLLVLFYSLYGKQFIDETYLFHLTRQDHRHSFSPFFYDIYLHYFDTKPIRMLPTFLFIFVLTNSMSRKFSMFYLQFLITFGFVQFNSVITLQYYQWVFGALLLVLPESRILTFGQHSKGFNLALQWLFGIGIWIWMSLKVQSEGDNILLAMWVICLGKILLDLWVLLGFIKTVKIQNANQIKKINLEQAKNVLIGKAKKD